MFDLKWRNWGGTAASRYVPQVTTTSTAKETTSGWCQVKPKPRKKKRTRCWEPPIVFNGSASQRNISTVAANIQIFSGQTSSRISVQFSTKKFLKRPFVNVPKGKRRGGVGQVFGRPFINKQATAIDDFVGHRNIFCAHKWLVMKEDHKNGRLWSDQKNFGRSWLPRRVHKTVRVSPPPPATPPPLRLGRLKLETKIVVPWERPIFFRWKFPIFVFNVSRNFFFQI